MNAFTSAAQVVQLASSWWKSHEGASASSASDLDHFEVAFFQSELFSLSLIEFMSCGHVPQGNVQGVVLT